MLREDIVEEVKAGMFHIWAVNTIDEGIELLTGAHAGMPNSAGRYPEGTINGRVDQRLRDLSDPAR